MPEPKHRAGRADLNRPSRPSSQGQSYFLGIGIDDYLYFGKLHNAVRDVQAVAEVLMEDYDVATDRCELLLNEEATRRKILRVLRQLAENIKANDKLIIYYSGHGHLNKFGRGFWIPHDAEKGADEDYVSNGRLKDLITDIPARHILLISDSCFSGAFFVQGARRADVVAKELERIPSRWALCSGRHDEQVSDGPQGGHSPFAESILRELKQNQVENLRVSSLVDRVIELTRANYEQLPEGNPMQGVGHKGGQYIFKLQAKEEKFWAHVSSAHQLGLYLDYLDKYPQGKYRQTAKEAINQLEDHAAWTRAKERNTISAYLDYKMAFPKGQHLKQAEEAIQTIRRGMTRLSNPKPAPKSQTPKARQEAPAKPAKKKEEQSVNTPSTAFTGKRVISDSANKARWKKISSTIGTNEKRLFIGMGILLIVVLLIWQPWRVPGHQAANITAEIEPQASNLAESDQRKPKEEIRSANSSAGSNSTPILPVMVNIAGGTFTMGCLNEERDGECYDRENPAHQVSLSSFSMSRYEVTNETFVIFLNTEKNQVEDGVSWYDLDSDYAKIKEENDRFVVAAGYAKHPVVGVSWYGARAYAAWLSERTRQNYRLPTEAEWEYAARGGAGGVGDAFLYSGGNDIDEVAWHGDNSGGDTQPVGQKKANQLGLYDMSGNVWEWCSDWYGDYTAAAQQNPSGPTTGDYRVLRGGSWISNPLLCRAAYRYLSRPTGRYFIIGFRLARS